MRGKNIVKLLTAIDLFARPTGVTIEGLSDELGIDKRSVYRLINTVEELGFPIYPDEDSPVRKKPYKLEESYVKKLPNIKLPDLNLTMSELIALYLIKGQKSFYQGTDVENRIDSAFAKLDAFVPDGLSDNLNKIKTLFVHSSKFAKDYTGKEELIESLTEAIFQNRTCLVTYHSFGDDEIKSFKVDPLYFFENKGGLYVFVNATSFNNILILAVERIKSLEVTDSLFEYPKDFDPESRLDMAFDIIGDDPIDVKIWFSADQARYIQERTWSPNQKISEQNDGSIIIEMKTSGWWDVKSWILSYGADAKVLEPEGLRKEILKDLKGACELYKPTKN